MSLTYDGEISVGAILPSVQLQIAADVTAATAELAAANAALVNIGLHPPTLAASIANVTTLLAQLNAAVGLGLPDITVGITANFTALIASLNATLAILTALQANMSAGGVFAYRYSGAGNALGAALTAELAATFRDSTPSSGPCNAFLLLTTTPATWTAMQAFFSGA